MLSSGMPPVGCKAPPSSLDNAKQEQQSIIIDPTTIVVFTTDSILCKMRLSLTEGLKKRFLSQFLTVFTFAVPIFTIGPVKQNLFQTSQLKWRLLLLLLLLLLLPLLLLALSALSDRLVLVLLLLLVLVPNPKPYHQPPPPPPLLLFLETGTSTSTRVLKQD